jgi:hypothetical protein
VRLILRTIDSRHGRDIPTGRKIARALRVLFRRQQREVVAKLRANPERVPSLNHWTQPMATAMEPLLHGYYAEGIRAAIRRIRRQLRARKRVYGTIRKDEGAPERILDVFDPSFDVFNPRVLDAIRDAVFAFCDATNQTATRDVGQAIQDLRRELSAGLERGEALRELTARVQEIFDDPARAFRIATTEASRAVHAGQLIAAEESGVVAGVRWLASSDACPLCLPLDGVEVPLGQPFVVAGTGPYASVFHPPRHPHCQCSMTEVLTPNTS